MNEFQDSLKELMDSKKLSRLGLSKQIGIPSATIDTYFNKNYYPQMDIAIKLARFFNCSLDYLFGLSNVMINHEQNNNDFFTNFNSLVKNNKLSIAKTMKNLKMGETNYYRWKKGMFPTTSNLIAIAKYFDVSLDFLIGNMWK